MTKESAMREARAWAKRSRHAAYVQYFHGAWSWSEMPLVTSAIMVRAR